VTQEFINIGIAVFSQEARYFRAICTTRYARITSLFQKIDGQRFRQLSQYIQDQICAVGREYETALPFESGATIEGLLARVLPPDDSAIQFSKAGVGLSSDLDRTLNELFQRHVERYALSGEAPSRSDEDVWHVFREPLDRAFVTPRLKPKRIVAANYEYPFQQAWKNEIWHVYEPVSFDLVEASSMLDKANRWVGRATSLMDSADPHRIYLLLGGPQDERLQPSFIKAQNILNKMPGGPEFIQESEADDFAQELAREVQGHPEEESGE
jgi:hypothetical protein